MSDKNNSRCCFASLVTAANCHLRAGAERCAEHLSPPPASGQHRAARPWRGTCAVVCPDGLSGRSVWTVCPEAAISHGGCVQWSFQTASQTPAGMLQMKGSGIQGARWGVQAFLIDTDICLFLQRHLCLLNNPEILLPPENLMRRFGWCRGFLVLLLYIKMNFTINRVSVSKFVNTALCINKCMK